MTCSGLLISFAALAVGNLYAFETDSHLRVSLDQLPLYFEPNAGQVPSEVRFVAHTNTSTFLLEEHGIDILRAGGHIRMRMEGSRTPSAASGERRMASVSNFYRGADRTQWRTGVPNYGAVRYSNVYRGIDVLFYGNRQEVEFDFVVAPHADPSAVELVWEGIDSLQIDAAGDLLLRSGTEILRQHRPNVYQQRDGRRVEIAASYYRKGSNRAGFRLGPYDPDRPLVIDPVLSYAAPMPAVESALGLAVDVSGFAYVTGSILSSANPGLGLKGGRDVYVMKWNPTGNTAVYTTYLGGASDDAGSGIAADTQGNAYVTGGTSSTDFPLAGAFQTLLNNTAVPCFLCSFDAFLVKLSSTGLVQFSSFYGGTGNDYGTNIVVDAATGNAYIAGVAGVGLNFPVTPGALRTNNGIVTGQDDGFILKTSGTSTVPVYSTLLGGDDSDKIWSLAVDGGGSAYVTGVTFSGNFPVTTGAYRNAISGSHAAFVAKLNPAGNALTFSTMTGVQSQVGAGIAVDGYGRPYFIADTITSGVFSRETIPASFPDVGSQAMVGKLNSLGTDLIFANTLTGSRYGLGIAVNSAGNVYATGNTGAANFATTGDAFSADTTPDQAFLSVFDPLGSSTVFSTILGTQPPPAGLPQSQLATGTRMGLDSSGSAYIAGIFNYNAAASQRNYVVKVGGFNFSPCTGSVAAAATSFGPAGGASSVTVSGTSGCVWTAVSSIGALGLGSTSGTGGAMVAFLLTPNTLPGPRTAAISVAGNIVPIIQKGTDASAFFNDVPIANPFFDHITLIRNAAITSGCTATQYCPDQAVTRSQMAAFIIRALLGGDNFPFVAAPYFSDVPSSHPFFKYIQKLRELNITSGCTVSAYCPDDPVTRGQMAAFLIRSRFGYQFPIAASPLFFDVPANNIFYNYIQKMKETGITTGCTTTQYCPDDTTTRAQMAAFLVRTFLTPW